MQLASIELELSPIVAAIMTGITTGLLAPIVKTKLEAREKVNFEKREIIRHSVNYWEEQLASKSFMYSKAIQDKEYLKIERLMRKKSPRNLEKKLLR